MSTIAIVPFLNARHRAQVVSLWQAVLGYDSPHNRPALSIDKKIKAGDGLFYVAMADDQVVGTVMAGYDGHRGWIYSVAVSPACRRQGIGSKLIAHAEQALIDMGCVKINLQILEGNEPVTAFYQSLGYQVEKRISMGKRISQNIPGQSSM